MHNNNNKSTFSEKLKFLLKEIEATDQSLPIKELIEITGSGSFGILLLFLSMPSALPIPAIGYSIPFGIAIFFLLSQMILGKQTPWLPQKIEGLTISPAISKSMLSFSIKIFSILERYIKPRYSFIGSNKITCMLMLVLTIIMIIPVPLTNTAPAGAIFLFSISIIEQDGILGLLAIFIGTLLLILYSTATYIFVIYGLEGLYAVKKFLLT